VSDHRLQASRAFPWVNNYLRKKGFSVLGPDGKVAWSGARAYMHPCVQIWINLKGREPEV